MCPLERSNMMAHHTMGTGQFMGLVRQRVRAVGAADTTDNTEEESELTENDTLANPHGSEGPVYGQSAAEMYEALRQEQVYCIRNDEILDVNTIQGCMLRILQLTRDGLSADNVAELRRSISETFAEMAENAMEQNRWESADRFQAVASIYRR